MKFLFDENISYRIVQKLEKYFPESKHVKAFNLLSIEDDFIFEFARSNGFDAIVTFDEDYRNISLLKKTPPKIIWLRIGNTSTDNIVNVLTNRIDEITSFISNMPVEEYSCLEIDNS